MANQCSWCGAPRNAISPNTPCKYCGTLAPIAEPKQSFTTGGAALCVCQVSAVWRCVVCDSPVCAQHRNAFWPGQSRANVGLADAAEASVWNYATNAMAHELAPGAAEVCTCCRSAFAGSQLDAYRTVRQRLDRDPFKAMLQLAGAGVETPRFYRSMPSHEFLEALTEYAGGRGVPPLEVARTWEVVGQKPVKVTSSAGVYAFKLRRRPDYLLVRTEEERKSRFGGRHAAGRLVAGPVVISSWQPAIPAPHPPAVVLHADQEPITGRPRRRYTLTFRAPDPHPAALQVGTYADVLLPLVRRP